MTIIYYSNNSRTTPAAARFISQKGIVGDKYILLASSPVPSLPLLTVHHMLLGDFAKD